MNAEEEFKPNYRYSIGSKKTNTKLLRTSGMGHTTGAKSVCYCYENEVGVEKDENKNSANLARMKDAYSVFMLGNCYQDGVGVEKDGHKAFIYFQKTAEMGLLEGINKV